MSRDFCPTRILTSTFVGVDLSSESVELRDCAREWLIGTAVALEADGLAVVSDMFAVIIANMGVDAVQPAALAKNTLSTASSEIETVTRVGDLLELAESVRPIFSACAAFASA